MASSNDRSFVHLHVHSEHSALDSTARVHDIIAAAKADGQQAVAITDHGSLAAIFDATKAGKDAGVKVIPGLEAYLAIGSRKDPQTIEVPADGASTDSGDEVSGKTKTKRYHHLTILATTPVGWRNLVAMHNASQSTRIGKYPAIDYELLAEHSEGLVALTGCLGGPVLGPLSRGDEAGAKQGLDDIIGAVGKDNVYVEVMDHGIPEETAVLPQLARLAKSYGLPLIATNDSHHVDAEGAHAHEAWLATQTQKTLKDPTPPRFAFTGHGYHMRTAEEMRAVRSEKWWAKACNNTLKLAERVAGDMMPAHYLRLPKFPVPDGFKDSRAYFIHLVKEGAKARYGDPYSDEVAQRLNTEMRVLSDFGVIDYFLIVHELITWARSQGILVGPGRGSAAGSVASYALGIVNVDPLRFDLLFERFLDPTRVGMPDIDVDFEKGRRSEVLAHLVEMYGQEFVARIGTFQVSKTKASLKSAVRVLSHPASLGDKLSKVVPMKGAESFTFAELDAQHDEAAAGFWETVGADTRAGEVVELARQFEQVTTGPSIHACGVVVSDVPLTDLVPMRKDGGKDANPDDPLITEWDADGVDDGIGLLKLDVLGIRNLDIISAAVRTIKELTGEVIDPDNLPDGDDLDDERVLKTWQLIARGHTAGLFQLDGSGMTELAQDVSPSSLEHMSALVALFRPGPLSANMHTIYAARKNGREKIDYGIFTNDKAEQAEIAKVLGDTFGLCIAEGQRVHSVTRGALVPIEDIRPGEVVQGVAADNSSATGTVTRVIDNGVKPVSEARFGGGFTLRATEDHRVLTPEGWAPLNEVGVGGLVAVPKDAIEPEAPSEGLNADRAKMLGYLIANGSLTHGSHVYLSTAEHAIAEGYTAAVRREFPDCHIGSHTRPNGVMSVSVTNGNGNGGKAGPMLAWMRELGLKFPIGSQRGGVGSSEKFIPASWLAAPREMAAAILAALWDCDGHISVKHGVRYKTVSPTLAEDIRHLLLRLGVPSTIARSTYTGSDSVERDAFDVLVNRFGAFADTVGRHLSHPAKREQCALLVDRTPQESLISRTYLRDAVSGQSVRGFCEEHGVPRSTFHSALPYTTERSARPVYEATGDQRLGELLNARWVRLESITPVGTSRVWDLEVEGIHSFVASGVIVHNCVYQEQMMMLGDVVAGFGPSERNRLRKGVSKKIASEVTEVGRMFMAGATSDTASDGSPKLSFSERTASKVWDTIKGGADYAFNRSHSAAYGQVAYITAFLKANWPAAFGAAVLSNTDDDDKRASMLRSLATEGITVLPPQINTAQFATTATDAHTVVLGLGETKDVGKAALAIIAERDKNGPFTGPSDILSRTRVPGKDDKAPASLTSTTLAALIEAGAMDEFGPRLGQMRVLRALRARPDTPIPADEWGLVERGVRQHQRLGLSLGQHPMSAISDQLKKWNPDLKDQEQNPLGSKPIYLHKVLSSGRTSVVTIGLVTGWKVKADNRGGQRATLHLEGSKGRIEAVVWDNTLRALRREGHNVGVGSVVGVLAKVRTREIEQRDEEGNTTTTLVHSLTVSRMWPLEYTDVDAHAPSGGLGLELTRHLFSPDSPLPAAATSRPSKVPTSAVFAAPEVVPVDEPASPPGEQEPIFVPAGQTAEGPSVRLAKAPSDFYEPEGYARTYRVDPASPREPTLLVVSMPEGVPENDLAWREAHMAEYRQAQVSERGTDGTGWFQLVWAEQSAQVAA